MSGESSPPEGAISPKRQRPGGTGKLAQTVYSAGKTGKPPVEFPHPVFWVAWPFGGEGEDGFRAEEVFAEESSENVAAFFFRNVTQDAVVLLNTESSREDIVKAYIETCQESLCQAGGRDGPVLQ